MNNLTSEEKRLAEEALERYIHLWSLEREYLAGKQSVCEDEEYEEREKHITFCDNRIDIAKSALDKFRG